MIEKRANRRLWLNSPMETSVKAVFSARMLDISPEGALLEVDRLLPLDLDCSLRVHHEGDDFYLSATVRRCRPGWALVDARDGGSPVFHAGVEFTETTRDTAQKLLARFPSPQAGTAVNDELQMPSDGTDVAWAIGPKLSVTLEASTQDLEPHPMRPPPEKPE